MLNPKFLYHEPTNSTIVVPPHSPLPEGPFLEEEGKGVFFYLLVMNPKDYVKLRWKLLSAGVLDLKWFIQHTNHTPQTAYLSNPDAIIRWEHIEKDCEELGISLSPQKTPPVPNRDLCISSCAVIRRAFAADYALGEYD